MLSISWWESFQTTFRKALFQHMHAAGMSLIIFRTRSASCSSVPSFVVCAFTDVGSSLWGQQESHKSFWREWFGIEMLTDNSRGSCLYRNVGSKAWGYQHWMPHLHAAETICLGTYCSSVEEKQYLLSKLQTLNLQSIHFTANHRT